VRRKQAVKNVAENSPTTKAIRKRMEEVRGDLDTGFQGIVNDARDIGDWTYYLKTYPWAVLGAALVAGYLIAPRLGFGAKPVSAPPVGFAARNSSKETPPEAPKSNIAGKLLSIVGPLVMREVTAYAMQQADRFLASRSTRSERNNHR
jgi:hypothetical protein